ncbi:carboxypeptidase-like regulatory domain-containing protein [uncultured Eudoraea sp.]|uniref:carboxypeptidase-like regulatory domain-containing protein n=1 Tax=uncultured Eudoraea sp. TaxID=1035614 RepID=UPI002628710A|nr:carboxypeptidase-like regulatory domain-containing protein [uncultured Eudoraea sp.]
MNKLILLYTLLFSGVFLVNGARSDSNVVLGSISGRVIDNVRKQPVAYAAIVIKLASDKSIITGGITNEDGTFQIKKLPDGEFNWESQTVFAGISYRFGSGKNKAVKRKRRDSNTKQSGGGIL